MKQIIYRAIYRPAINKVLRNINRISYPILPNKVKISPSGTLRIKNSEGKFMKLKTNQTSYLAQLIFWQGYENFEYTDIFIRLIKKINVFYDIGANIGYYSILAGIKNSNIKVIGFEPASGPLFFYKENVRINGLKNITVEDIALSEKEGEITFYEVKNNKYTYLEHNLSGESNAGSKTTNRNFVPIKKKTTTLNNYVTDTNEKYIDLIKIDTEGTEHFILEKSSIVLEEMKPIIICETLFNTIESNLESIFKKHGYEFYNHTNNGLKKVETITRDQDNGVRNCFFVHPSRYPLIKEFVI